MDIALCDDLYEEVAVIESYLIAHGHHVDVYSSGEDLVAAYQKGARYDAAFIDMEMNTLNGFDTANAIREIDDTVLVSFVTSHHDYFAECFECGPVWFLDKPVQVSYLERAVAKTEQMLSRHCRTYTFSDSHQSVRLRCDEILYFEAQAHNIIIHEKNGDTHTIRKTMKELVQELEAGFCRVHNSYIVNLQYLTYLGSEEVVKGTATAAKKHKTGRTVVTLAYCDTNIPVGRAYKKNVNDAFIRFQQERYLK